MDPIEGPESQQEVIGFESDILESADATLATGVTRVSRGSHLEVRSQASSRPTQASHRSHASLRSSITSSRAPKDTSFAADWATLVK